MSTIGTSAGAAPAWHAPAILLARLIFAALFAMATSFKFMDIAGTAGYIAMVGFPAAQVLAWCAALFELALTLCFLTGAFFTEASLLGAIYVVFLAFAFHGQSHWGQDQAGQMEFGAFVSHFPFAAGLLFAAVHGPGRVLAARIGLLKRG